MEHPVSDLSPEARALLAAAADGDDPSPADRDRVARAIAVPLGITALVPAAAQAAGGAMGAATGLGVAKVVAAGVVVLGLGGGAWVKARRDRSTSARATVAAVVGRASARVPRATPPPSPRPPAAPPRATPEEPLRVTAPATTPSPPTEVRPLPRPTRSEAVSAGSLRAESELLAAAHRALLAGDASAALARIADYDTRFPRGALREERDLERVLALCAAGRGAESRAAARRFVRSFPDSPSVARAAGACAETIPSRDADAPGTQTPATAPAAPSRAE